jgi:hypothetical protein
MMTLADRKAASWLLAVAHLVSGDYTMTKYKRMRVVRILKRSIIHLLDHRNDRDSPLAEYDLDKTHGEP